jgi:hypothetical protein
MDQQELFTNSIPDPGQRWVASFFYIPREHYTEALSRIRIRVIHIIFQDPDPGSVPRCLGSGSISYSNEHNKINRNGKFNKVPYAFWLGPGGPADMENQVKKCKKYCFMYVSSLKR